MTATGLGGWRARALLGAGLAALAAAGLLLATTRVEIEGRWRGLFLLRARDGRMLELKDDLYLGDGSRLLVGTSFSMLRRWLGAGAPPPAPGEAALELDWDERAGRGQVRNRFADGRELVTLLGRYEDGDGGHPRGLFVGGALPDVSGDLVNQDQSGMALHEPKGWFHIWCSVNEALVDMDGPTQAIIYPGSFRYLGSRVLVQDARRVVLESNHEIALRRGRLRMDRFAYFTAGEPFFKLGIRLTALGPEPVTYSYLYGDEPWVGHFGTAVGNYGWVEGEVIPHEGKVDQVRHRWGGIVDLKSDHAAYIEWLGDDLPDDVYFSNNPGFFSDAAKKVPLASNEIFVGLQWVGRRLRPGEGRTIRLAIGLAGRDPRSGLPRRPSAAALP
jgi:hypothetical protein